MIKQIPKLGDFHHPKPVSRCGNGFLLYSKINGTDTQ